MNRSRSNWDKKAPQSTVTRITRSSSSQTRHTDPPESLEPGSVLYGKQRKRQTDSTLVQDLSQMSVSGQKNQQPPRCEDQGPETVDAKF